MKPSPSTRHLAETRPARQGGMSIWLLLFLGALLFIVGGTALRILPTFLEYMSIQSAVEKAAAESNTQAGVTRAFNRAATIENITSLTGNDLIIEKTQNGVQISFAYEKRIPLAGPVNILMDYRGSAMAAR
ncbi:MAG: DUF4845 domain-containing protein [Burkholderiaceae bacterium]